MTVTLDIPEELEGELSAEAERLGLSLSDYALLLLSSSPPLKRRPRNGAELIDHWDSQGLIGARKDIRDSQAHAERARNVSERRDEPSKDVEKQGPQILQTEDPEFDQQKLAFNRIPSESLQQYTDQFVAARNGQIVDHDEDLAALTGRFFDQYGDVPVYITRIGEPHRIVLRTPFLRRM